MPLNKVLRIKWDMARKLDMNASVPSPSADSNSDVPSWGLDFSGGSVFPEMQHSAVTSPDRSELHTPPLENDGGGNATSPNVYFVSSCTSRIRNDASNRTGGIDQPGFNNQIETCANIDGVVMSLRDVHVDTASDKTDQMALDMKNVG